MIYKKNKPRIVSLRCHCPLNRQHKSKKSFMPSNLFYDLRQEVGHTKTSRDITQSNFLMVQQFLRLLLLQTCIPNCAHVAANIVIVVALLLNSCCIVDVVTTGYFLLFLCLLLFFSAFLCKDE